MDKKQIDKYIDNKMKEYFLQTKEKFTEIEQDVLKLEDSTEKSFIEIKNSFKNRDNTSSEYSSEIKQLIIDDLEDQNNKILQEANSILPSLIGQRKENLSYAWIALFLLFVIQIFFVIFKM